MPFKEGQSGNPNGRPKGSENKLTKSIKEMVFNALNDERVGGEEGFIEWIIASKGNRAAFYTWLMKMLPTNVGIEHSGHIKASLSIKDLKKSIEEYKESGS